MQSPFQMVPLHDDRARNLASSAPLELWTDVHEDGTVLRSIPRRSWIETDQLRAGVREKAIQRTGGTVLGHDDVRRRCGWPQFKAKQ